MLLLPHQPSPSLLMILKHTYSFGWLFDRLLLKQRETYSTRTHQFQFSCCSFFSLSFKVNRLERLIVINLFHLWLNSFLFSIKRQRATSFVTAVAANAEVSNSSDGDGGSSLTRVCFLYLRPRVLFLLRLPHSLSSWHRSRTRDSYLHQTNRDKKIYYNYVFVWTLHIQMRSHERFYWIYSVKRRSRNCPRLGVYGNNHKIVKE